MQYTVRFTVHFLERFELMLYILAYTQGNQNILLRVGTGERELGAGCAREKKKYFVSWFNLVCFLPIRLKFEYYNLF